MGKKASLATLNRELNSSAPVNEAITTQQKKSSKEYKPMPTDQPVIPRGQRGDFQKLTITMPSSMLISLKTVGLHRKAAGNKDCDSSSLIREAVQIWLGNQ